MKQLVRSVVPPRYRETVRLLGNRMLHYGTSRFCPCCESQVDAFRPYGAVPRPGARCPVCGALERHRLLALYLRSRPALMQGIRRLLHIAPEAPVARLLGGDSAVDYISVDIQPEGVKLAADITNLAFADGSFDAIYCSHVLEHVDDDRRAMSELLRVLRPGAWLVLQVPIKGEVTREDPAITEPEERLRLFGQVDHVRVYGRDFKDRLESVGLTVQVENPAREMRGDVMVRFGVNPDEDIFFCRRPRQPISQRRGTAG